MEEEYKTREEYVDGPIRTSSQLPLSHQEKAIAELHETISQLTSRLKPVLTPDVPSDNARDKAEEARPIQSPLAAQLASNNTGINNASRKLRALMERLEC